MADGKGVVGVLVWFWLCVCLRVFSVCLFVCGRLSVFVCLGTSGAVVLASCFGISPLYCVNFEPPVCVSKP